VAAKAQPPIRPSMPPPELPANPQQPAHAPSQPPPPSTEMSDGTGLPASLRAILGL
jgi:hypothetical protein